MVHNSIHALSAARPLGTQPSGRPSQAPASSAFGAVLAAKMAQTPSVEPAEAHDIHFSKHAEKRLRDRHIDLSSEDMVRLERATDMAEAKGAREALMMLGNVNFIVSVRNRTVVTAMQAGQAEDMVFTNIDTAVMLSDEQRGGS